MATATVQQAVQAALAHHQAGRLQDAEAIYRQVLEIVPDHADALHLLGVIAQQTGRHESAVALIGRSIQIRADVADYHNNLGAAYRSLNRTEESIASYRRAVELQPNYPEALNNLGAALQTAGRFDEAIAAFARAVDMRPDYPEALSNLAGMLGRKGDHAQAEIHSRRAADLLPTHAEAHYNLGVALRSLKRLDEAAAAFRRSIEVRPTYAEAHNNLAGVLGLLHRHDEAIVQCKMTIELRPDYAEAHYNLALAHHLRGEHAAAIAAYDKAIAIKPTYADARWNRAIVILLTGELPRGLADYECRWQTTDFPSTELHFPQPRWDGSDPAGKTILLHAEQGIGDAVHFARYAILLAERRAKVLLVCQKPLQPLLAQIPTITTFASGQTVGRFDLHCPLLSLPFVFGTALETIPAKVPYLRAPAARTEHFKQRLESFTGLKVGLVWAGNPDHKNDSNRSVSLSDLTPLAQIPGVVFLSLQKGPAAAQAKSPPTGMNLIDWTDDLHDFADTAALIANLDLVISVDTAVVHVAGALAKPTWILLPFVPDWRWLLDRDDSPWYPTVQLFRQRTLGDWPGVVARVADRLAEAARGPGKTMNPD
jgi:tetratricopeptide (TPR) repeat protein